MFNRILLAVDGSPHSERSLEYAMRLGEKFGSEIIVTHVVERTPSWFGLEASEKTPAQAALDVDVVGVPAERMRPEQAAHDVDVVGVPAERMRPEQVAHDVDVVGVPADRKRAEQLAQEVEVVGIPKPEERPEQLAWEKDVFGRPSDELLARFEMGSRIVEDFAARLKEAGLNARTRLAQGLVADGILDVARANDCDAIIIGARGVGTARRLLGSVSSSVVSKAEIPVLVVH
ncbi:MAG: universal stress protein [Chloroflexi bacterium]|nr:MAG: universal stress protein [Chloroflexota bacterium]